MTILNSSYSTAPICTCLRPETPRMLEFLSRLTFFCTAYILLFEVSGLTFQSRRLQQRIEFGRWSKRPIALHGLAGKGPSASERREIQVNIKNDDYF